MIGYTDAWSSNKWASTIITILYLRNCNFAKMSVNFCSLMSFAVVLLTIQKIIVIRPN